MQNFEEEKKGKWKKRMLEELGGKVPHEKKARKAVVVFFLVPT